MISNNSFIIAEVEKILSSMDKSLKNIAGMPYPKDGFLDQIQNMLWKRRLMTLKK